MKLQQRALRALAEGPATSFVVALELGVSPKQAAACLSNMARKNIIKRTLLRSGSVGRPAYQYENR